MRSRLKWGDFVIIAAVLLLAAGIAVALALGQGGGRLYAEVCRIIRWSSGSN